MKNALQDSRSRSDAAVSGVPRTSAEPTDSLQIHSVPIRVERPGSASHIARRISRVRPADIPSPGELSSYETRSETLPEEVPVALVYNGISQAVMLATPNDLEDFALGFSLSEGILKHAGELYEIDTVEQAMGIELRLEISAERFAGLKERRRNLAGRTGCGLCGVESLDQAIRQPLPVADGLRVPVRSIQRALAELPDQQPLYRATHAVHGAAWADRNGEIMLVREDVGRHNALDKLLGALACERFTANSGFMVITSRASVEMVQKAAALALSYWPSSPRRPDSQFELQNRPV